MRELNVTHNRISMIPDADCWACLAALVSLPAHHGDPLSLGQVNAPEVTIAGRPGGRVTDDCCCALNADIGVVGRTTPSTAG